MAAPSPFDSAIWGFYEHISDSPSKDELGSLNLLTSSRILRASQTEIQHGRLCSLNWEVHKPFPQDTNGAVWSTRCSYARDTGLVCVDDEIYMNTQCGSQWDGFRHWSYYKTGQFYNDLHVSEVLDLDGDGKGKLCAFDEPGRNGIHAFQGKIAGRGVLLDFYSYAQANGIDYAPNAYYTGVKFEQGDILFVRMGFVHWYETAATGEEKEALAKPPPRAVGIRQSMEEVEWLWDHHFSAVASDTPAFEARPNKLAEWNLHDYLLALWGLNLKTPMGELFDLEELSKICKELGRYSFFVTSSPLNIVNGIASPPNITQKRVVVIRKPNNGAPTPPQIIHAPTYSNK
ncbi:hypothetical protein BJ912DRAFT_926706 [Pholiota molesta]|nr:hypothetical protein BJ912DRAFT_926706 [Pholiota molesta]